MGSVGWEFLTLFQKLFGYVKTIPVSFHGDTKGYPV